MSKVTWKALESNPESINEYLKYVNEKLEYEEWNEH